MTRVGRRGIARGDLSDGTDINGSGRREAMGRGEELKVTGWNGKEGNHRQGEWELTSRS